MMGDRSKWARHRASFAAALSAAAICLAAGGHAYGQATQTSEAVMRGWRTLHTKKCVECHAIWGQGGRMGPDLGRIRSGPLSEGQLAGVMWNHIPKMLGRMEQTGRPPVTLTGKEMSDLFALIFFVRQLDESGDPLRGEAILRNKGCTQCHETDTSGEGIGPDLAKWGKYANPISWAQMMWEHAPMMEEAMRRSDMNWPELEGADLVHIVAYVRSVGVSGDKSYLRPGSPSRGRELFAEKGCNQCHPGSGPDLAEAELPTSVGALASRMWNHSPDMARKMREEDVERKSITPQELADILTYVLSMAQQAEPGDPAHGQRVFVEKGCVQCHEEEKTSAAGGPPRSELGHDANAVSMAAAMWNHGETMLQQMTEAGLAWPVFSDREMVDLLAYLKEVRPDKEQQNP